jgi:hypothetical protein
MMAQPSLKRRDLGRTAVDGRCTSHSALPGERVFAPLRGFPSTTNKRPHRVEMLCRTCEDVGSVPVRHGPFHKSVE